MGIKFIKEPKIKIYREVNSNLYFTNTEVGNYSYWYVHSFDTKPMNSFVVDKKELVSVTKLLLLTDIFYEL